MIRPGANLGGLPLALGLSLPMWGLIVLLVWWAL
jgi:hypothetical protein